MTSTAEQLRVYRGPAILNFGFRPFFLGGAVWAILAIAISVPYLNGMVQVPTVLSPLDWHRHELLFGYTPAIIAGFLLTAVPNWTGRPPVVGNQLLGLAAVWVCGRLAMLVSAHIGRWTATFIDVSFLAVLVAFLAKEVISANNSRNIKIVAIVALLLAANLIFHIETNFDTGSSFGARLGLSTILILLMLIGGRIIPSFTRNWLAGRPAGRTPVQFNRFDVATIVASGVALACWTALPQHPVSIALFLACTVLHTVRLARWAGDRTLSEPLVLILHIAYAFIPIGFALTALAELAPKVLRASGALHAWTIGAIALMTLAIMTRASLGHSGRQLRTTPAIQAIYLSAFAAVATRLAAAFQFATSAMIYLSTAFWVLAFTGFIITFWPMLTKPRVSS